MKKIIALLVALVVSAPAFAVNLKPFDGPTPPLKLQGLDGKTHDLNDDRGKVVLVQFWATYCGPCRKEMPSMNKLLKSFEGKPFDILAVDMGETKEEVQAFVNEVKPEFTILLNPEGDAIAAWNAFAVPANFLIDKTGKIRYTLFGGTDWAAPEIAQTITELINE